MTRFARRGPSLQQNAHASTPWSSQKEVATPSSADRQTRRHGHAAPAAAPLRSRPKPRKTGAKAVSQAWSIVKRGEKRRINRLQIRESKKVCYNCRQSGHAVADCPALVDATDQGTGICFKCGSTEHSSGTCTAKVDAGVYPFAKCFICNESGHIAKQCPDNPRGLYPNGGCCRHCGCVDHYQRDCPELLKQKGVEDIKVLKIDSSASVDDDGYIERNDKPVRKKATAMKVVKF